MDIGCTPFFVTGWEIFYCGWKIGWEISRFEDYLPVFIVLKVRELRRFWEIWQIFHVQSHNA